MNLCCWTAVTDVFSENKSILTKCFREGSTSRLEFIRCLTLANMGYIEVFS